MDAKFHLSLDVDNIDASVQFYSVLLNGAPAKHKPGYAKFDMQSPAVNLALEEKSHCCLQGLSHLGLRVQSSDEIQVIRKRLEEAGYSTREEANTTCCYALQDKFWVSDPTGYRWEVYILKADTEHESAPEQQACCA
jgi:catechol 2,3-dioxygenase-like lactoylglutathione lyase family enzyme